MISRERVQRALTFNKPNRVPIFKPPFNDVFVMLNMPSKGWQPNEKGVYPHLGDGSIAKLKIYEWKQPDWAIKNWWKYDREEVDEWGCYWNKKASDFTMGHPGRPVIDTWDKLDTWEGPNVTDKQTYKYLGRLSQLNLRNYRVALIHDAQFIVTRASMARGFTNLLIDYLRNPKQVHHLIKKITDIFMTNIEMWLQYNPDGFFIYDDLGTQSGLFFSPEIFKKYYADPYKEIINYLHDHDYAFHLHSCGNIGELIPTLIDIGVDSIELDSPHQTGIERLLEFRGKIPFWACVDIQSVYPKGSPEEVEQEVIKMIQTFSTQEGGYLAYFYPQPKAINIPKVNIQAFHKALKKWGKYPLKCLS
ncbi:MAG: hypothetical protein HWN66_12825 [Candidatus Helarchaeota archaeon]|nr:hypothetical protein [Candidatus Helarchaeota archaeon]